MRTRGRGPYALILALGAAALWLAPCSARGALSCSFVSVTGVNFGNYDVYGAADVASSGGITFNCKKVGGVQTLSIDISQGGSGTYFPRKMSKGVERLNYNLYLDAAHTQVWGNSTGGTVHFGPFDPIDNFNHVVTVYGLLPAGQDVSAGLYSDTVVVTINF